MSINVKMLNIKRLDVEIYHFDGEPDQALDVLDLNIHDENGCAMTLSLYGDKGSFTEFEPLDKRGPKTDDYESEVERAEKDEDWYSEEDALDELVEVA